MPFHTRLWQAVQRALLADTTG